MASVYTPDGCNFVGEIPSEPGITPAVRFRYRLAGLTDKYRWQATRWPDVARVGAEIICAHLRELEALGDDGKTWTFLDLTPDLAQRLHHTIFDAMIGYILGMVPPKNPDPLKKSGAESASA